MNWQLFAVIIYFLAMLSIGFVFFFKSKENSDKDYFLGGRSMGPWVTAMSAQASDMSGWLLMGFPGSIFAFGMGKVWIGIGLALGTAANWIFVARRLRRFSAAANDSITMPQYLTNRFASANPALKVICAIIFLISFTVYVASAFNAGTTVLSTVIPWFQTRQELAMVIFAAIILLYTFMGGYKAVCWTDFFQGILMLVAVLAVPIVMTQVGSFNPVYNGAFADGVTAFSTNPFTVPWQDIVTGLGWGLGYFGMPHILVRFMAIKKSSMIKKSATVAIIWVVLSLGAAIAIAILGRTFVLGDNSLARMLLADNGGKEKIFVEIVRMIFPSFIVGLLLSAIIAAAMSTADSQLLVASSSFTSDIYQPIIRKNKAGDKEMLWVGRLVVVIVALVAFFIARTGLDNPDSWAGSIMALVESAWGLFGAAFGPVIILSLFWKRFNYAGAVAGILAGAAVDITWFVCLSSRSAELVKAAESIKIIESMPNFFTKMFAELSMVYEIVPAFIVGLIAAIVVTLLTKKPSDEVIAIYEKATDKSIDD